MNFIKKSQTISNGHPSIGWGNRGWLEITNTILQACETNSLKTNIMNECNLNSVQIEKYLHYLLTSKLIKTKKKSSSSKKYVYKTTDKGRNYLNAYQNLIGILNGFTPKKLNYSR